MAEAKCVPFVFGFPIFFIFLNEISSFLRLIYKGRNEFFELAICDLKFKVAKCDLKEAAGRAVMAWFIANSLRGPEFFEKINLTIQVISCIL